MTPATGFWHEAYFMQGGMEAIYDDMADEAGFFCASLQSWRHEVACFPLVKA
jgi:hypothetical protein